MARNKKVEILSNGQEVLHPITDGDCVIFSDGQTLTQKLSEDDSVKYTPEVTNSSPMFKVGEGNTVDYSDNVLDGAYERATLQGQTYVNYIQESSADEVTLPTPFTEYERTQHNTLTSNEEGTLGINLVGQSYTNALQHDSEESYVVLGEDLEFQEKKVEYTNEGQIKSAMLKGQTLVNLQKVDRVEDVSTQSYKDTWQTVITKQQSYNMWRTGDVSLFKPNTKYLCIMEVKENTFTLPASLIIGHDECIFEYNETMNPTSKTEFQPKETGRKITILTTKDNFDGATCSQRFATNMENVKQGEKISFRTMLLEYQEGMENWDIPFFEGMQSVTVSTKLENKTQPFSNTCKQGKTFTSIDAASRSLYVYSGAISATNPMNLKPNTKYLIHFKISDLVLDGLSSIELVFSTGIMSTGDCLFGEKTNTFISANGVYNLVFTTTDLITSSAFVIKGLAHQWENSGSSLRSLTISNVMCIEYQNGMENWDLPYFEDYQVMKPVQVESVNKNLCPVNKNDFYNIHFKAGTQFILSTKDGVASQGGNIVFKDIDGNDMWMGMDAGTTSKLYTLSKDAYAIHNFLQSPDVISYQLEQGNTATEYVPHQSKTTYSWDEVTLRKVGDVEDTLDLTTGEWVQRIEEIVLDDSKIYSYNEAYSTENHSCFDFYFSTTGHKQGKIYEQSSSQGLLCDLLTPRNWTSFYNTKADEEGIVLNRDYGVTIHLKIAKNKLASQDYEGAKQYFSQNPITIQYVLATPIVHKVNLSRPNLQVYDDITHVHTKCLDGTLIPNIYLPSDISYPAILEPSKKYNVSINHTEVSTDNPLKVNVGGTEITMTDSRMTLTTPATLANSNVSFTGKGNKIKESMLIKNSNLLTGDLPHFNGIGSVQLGKTITNLCESKISPVGNSAMSQYKEYEEYVEITISTQGSRVITSKLLKPLKDGKKYFIYAPNDYPDAQLAHASFHETYNNVESFTRLIEPMKNKKYAIIEINQANSLYDMVVIGFHNQLPTGTYTINRPIICEYEPSMENWDWESIGYFTGTKNIGNEFMRVQNKNLFDGTFYGGYFENVDGNGIPVSIGSLTVYKTIQINLKKGEYTISFPEYCNIIRELKDGNVEHINTSNVIKNYTFIINNDGLYALAFRKTDSTNIPDNFSVQIEESSTATTYTAHKKNTLYIRKDQPIELTWEQGRINPSGVGDSYTNAINNTVSYGVRNKGLLNLKPNTTYRLSLGDTTTYKWHITLFDNWDCALQATNLFGLLGDWSTAPEKFFTTTKEYHKIGINIQRQDSGSLSASTIIPCRLEEVEEIKLRGINGVCDELDITRGIYTQRIGEVVFDGSEGDWQVTTENIAPKAYINGYISAFCSLGEKYTTTMIMDRYNKISNISTAAEGFMLNSTYFSNDNNILLRVEKDKIVENSNSSFRNYLKSNPITVQYRLAEPIVHKVHIGNKNELGTEVAKPNGVFTLPTLYAEQAHIDLTNNGLMPKVQSRDYIAYPISPMINKTYTLQHNLTGGVSNLTVDLLGRTQLVSYQNHKSLIYSPETILHNELRISGKGKISKVMYIDDGYMDRDIPYIEGMKNAVNPIVKNVGKNLISFDNMYSSYITNGSLSYVNNTITKLKDGYNDIQLFIYLINGKHYYFGLDGNIGVGGVEQPVIVLGKMHGWREFPEQQRIAPNKDFIYRGQTGWTTLHMVNINYINDIYITEVQGHENCESYKENICYVDCGEIRLTPNMFEQGNIVYNGANASATYDSMKQASNIRVRMKELIKIKPNTQYLLNIRGGYRVFVREFDVNKGKLNDSALSLIEFQSRATFTTNTNAQYIALLIGKLDETSLPLSDFNKLNLLLMEEDNMVILRSLPNGVCDEIDLETGKYIQRVGEVVLDGSGDEGWFLATSGEKQYYATASFSNVKSLNDGGNQITVCDKLGTPSSATPTTYKYVLTPLVGMSGFAFSLDWSMSLEEAKLWLQENPITVQYELAEPIVKDIVIHNYPHSYEGGHVIIENGDPNTPIPAQITYRAVTNRSGQIQQHTEQVEKQEQEINELEMLILANISNQTRS